MGGLAREKERMEDRQCTRDESLCLLGRTRRTKGMGAPNTQSDGWGKGWSEKRAESSEGEKECEGREGRKVRVID